MIAKTIRSGFVKKRLFKILCIIFIGISNQLLFPQQLFSQCTEAKVPEMAHYKKLTETQDAQTCSQCAMLALYHCSARYTVTDEDKKRVLAAINGQKRTLEHLATLTPSGAIPCCPELYAREPEWGIMVGKSQNKQTANQEAASVNKSDKSIDKTATQTNPYNNSVNNKKNNTNGVNNNKYSKPHTGNNDFSEETINNLVKQLGANPENPLNINGEFLNTFSELLPDGSLKTVLKSYSSNLGTDENLNIRQVYWDLSKAFDTYPTIANNNQLGTLGNQLNLMFDGSGLLTEKLKNTGNNYDFGSFITNPNIIDGLSTITGSFQSAQALGMGVELIGAFMDEMEKDAKRKNDYKKLALLSKKNLYVENDANLNSALIDVYMGIEGHQQITPLYRYDFNNGSSLRVENGILKFFSKDKVSVKNLMVVDKKHDGNYYNYRDVREKFYTSIAISPDEKAFYIYVNPNAISDVRCNDCLKKSGNTIETETGKIIHNNRALFTPYIGNLGVDFYNSYFDDEYGFVSPQLVMQTINSDFGIYKRFFKSKQDKDADEKGIKFVSGLDKNKRFLINNKSKKFRDYGTIENEIFDGYVRFLYLYQKDDCIISLFWANDYRNNNPDSISYGSSMLQISKKRDYYNADGMINQLTGLAMAKNGDLYFTGKNGMIGKLEANQYKLDDPGFTNSLKNNMNKKLFANYNFIADKKYITGHGQVSRLGNNFPIFPTLQLTPDEKQLIYIVNDNLYIISPNNFDNVKTYKLLCEPYNIFFTKENGDWIINLMALNDYKFPIVKKYSLGKLSTMDIEKNKKSAARMSGKKESNATPTSKPNVSLSEEIRKLKALYDEGVITKEEFEKAKAKLLDKNN